MEFLLPLAIVVLIVVVGTVAARRMGQKDRPAHDAAGVKSIPEKAQRRGREVTREMAAEASSKLTPEVHRKIYSFIAQGEVLHAIKEYRQLTHEKLAESVTAVTALKQFPQPLPSPSAPAAAPSLDAGTDFTVEDIVRAAPQVPVAPTAAQGPKAYRYRAIVYRGDEVREVVSTRLNEEIYSNIRLLALSKEYDGAARLLLDHADISEVQAQEFVRMIDPQG